MTVIGGSSVNHTVSDGRASVTLSWECVTDTGRKRTVNEDSALARPAIFAVADGMGGHSAGDVASAVVVTRLGEYANDQFIHPDSIEKALRAAVEDIFGDVGETDLGSGTTATGAALVLVDGVPHWLVFNVGDSRVYQLVGGTLDQLTVDHSVVQEMVDAGLISRDEADVHPQANVITRAVGFHEPPVPDYRVIPVTEGMRLLICSDGLTKEVTDEGLRHFLDTEQSPEDAAHKLIELALNNGGRDNVTLVVIDVVAVGRGLHE